jgi:hypothetical protein
MADTLVKNPKLIVGTQAQVEAEMGANDIGFATDVEFYTAKQIDELLEKSGGASLPILMPTWSDHLLNDVSWLRADTFSWQSGDVYVAAYGHLVADFESRVGRNVDLCAWGSESDPAYTISELPKTGEVVYKMSGDSIIAVGTVRKDTTEGGSLAYTSGSSNISSTRSPEYDKTDMVYECFDTIGGITITYYLAQDGHKICLPDQESNVVALYEATGVAWYYILDTENKQFKLPRTKYGFTGLRDEVGKYVPESLPNIKGTFLNGHYVVNGTGAFYDAGGGGTKELGDVADDRKVGFDASRSSSAYKDGAPVQQRATQMYLYFYVGNFEQSAIEQTAGLNAELFNGKADIDDVANLAMPGDRYVDLTLGASNSSYTAPADGYVILGKRVGANTMQFNCLKVANDSGYISRIESANSVSGLWATVMMPVKKGCVFSVEYSTTGTVAVFRFVYANGAK